MKKINLLVFAFGASAFIFGVVHYESKPKTILDTNYLVELKTDVSKGIEEVEASQKDFKKELRNALGFDYEICDSYKNAANALLIKTNKNFKNVIESLPDVQSVTKDQFYYFSKDNAKVDTLANAETTLENFSCQTMNVPIESKKGEGTLVAILDSGFLLNHNAFAGLDTSVIPRYDELAIQNLMNGTNTFHAKFTSGIVQNEDPSGNLLPGDKNTYYNSKIPFQYDYGGAVYTQVDQNGLTNYFVLDPVPGDPNNLKPITDEEVFSGISKDSNAYSPYSDHGTHVAGLVAGHDTKTYAPNIYDGVAPNAQLALMKVFTDLIPVELLNDPTGNNGQFEASTGAMDSCILSALEDCALLDVDVINMSLGQDLNDFETKSMSFKAFGILKENGTLVNVAAGNNGREAFQFVNTYAQHLLSSVETGTMGSYANSYDALTIGSGTLDKQTLDKVLMIDGKPVAYADQVTIGNHMNQDNLLSSLIEKTGINKFQYVYVPGVGRASDYNNFDVTGKVVFIDRGEITFVEKVQEAIAHKAIAAIIVESDPSMTDLSMHLSLKDFNGNIPIPVCLTLNRDRDAIKNANVCEFELQNNISVQNPEAGRMSEFSTDGSNVGLRIKPEITAPGSEIKGPVPGVADSNNGMEFAQDKTMYQKMSGTSMSTPNYSGASALLLSDYSTDRQTRKEYAKTLPARTMSTAKLNTVEHQGETIDNDLGTKTFYSPRRQGAGFVDVLKARESKVYLEGETKNKAKIELFNTKDISEGRINLEFSVHNETGTALSFTPTVYVMRPGVKTNQENLVPNPNGDGSFVYENPEWHNVKTQALNDKLIMKEQLTDISVSEVATSKIKLPTINVKQNLIDEINTYFPNGTYLEGYVVLEPTVSSEQVTGVKTLNMPYMGFFGDYYSEEPVEKFDFEKKEGELLGSDLIHTLAKRAGLNNSYYGSCIRGLPISALSDDNFNNNLLEVWHNRKSIKSISKSLFYDKDTNTIYAGAKEKTDLLIFQMFVNRSIASTSIALTKEGDTTNRNYAYDVFGENRPRLYSPIYGASADYIAKSMSTFEFLSGVLAHRAYGYLPLNGLDDGNYILKLNFELQASRHLNETQVTSANKTGWFTKTVNVVIDNTLPIIHHVNTTELNNSRTLNLYIDEANFKKILINNINANYTIDKDSNYPSLYHASIKLDEISNISADGKLLIEIEDISGNINKYLMNVAKNGHVYHYANAPWLTNNTYKITAQEVFENGISNIRYYIYIYDENGQEKLLSTNKQLTITIDVSNFDMSKFNLYRVDTQVDVLIRIKNYSYDVNLKILTFKTKGNCFQLDASGSDTTFSMPGKRVEPTCTKAGYYEEIVYSGITNEAIKVIKHDIPKIPHDWSAWEKVKDSTCSEAGYETRVCKVCGEIETRYLEKLPHNLTTRIENRIEPTCTSNGSYKLVTYCADCGEVIKVETISIPTKDHNYSSEWTIDVEPTCTKSGEKSHHCTDCDARKDVTIIPATGHKEATRQENRVEATCITDGHYDLVTYCAECGEVISKETITIPKKGHTFSDQWTVDKEPTCTEPGEKSHHCNDCDARKDITEIPAKGHTSAVRVENAIEATCSKEGSYELVTYCTECGKELSREKIILPKLNHNYGDERIIDKEPTCSEPGEESHHCKDCGARTDIREIPPLDHKTATRIENRVESTCCTKGHYDLVTYCIECGKEISRETIELPFADHTYGSEWVIDKEPTCTEPGEKSHHCTECGARTDVTEIQVLPHNETTKIENRIEPTCTKEGSYELVTYCKECGKEISRETIVIPKKDHDYNDQWTIDKEPTCSEPGEKSHHCKDCNARTDITEIPTLPHNEATRIENKIDATCTKEGSYELVTYCKDCGKEISRELITIPKKYHNVTEEWVIDKEPTCTEPGEKSHHCKDCGERVDITEIPAKGHDTATRIENKIDATCTKDGSYELVTYCKDCGKEISRETILIPKIEHNLNDEWTIDKEPTCTDSGSKSHHCKDCDYKEDVTEIPALGHEGKRIVTKEATEDEEGVESFICSRCGETIETRSIPKLPKTANNTPYIIAGSVGGVALLIAAIIAVIVLKKKKH